MADPEKAAEPVDLLRCAVGDRSYCIRASSVLSLQRPEGPFLPSPEKQGPIGWLEAQGQRVPVHHLSALLQASASRSLRPGQVILLLRAREPVGIVVDSVSRVTRIARGDLLSMPDIAQDPKSRLFEGVVRFEDRLILCLAAERVAGGLASGAPPVLPDVPQAARRSEGTGTQPQGPRQQRLLLFSTTKVHYDDSPMTFGLSLTQVPEILLQSPWLPVPKAPRFVLGLVAWRDQAVPVVDLHQRFGFAPLSVDPQSRILIARASTSPELTGLLVRPEVRIESLPLASKPLSRKLPFPTTFVRGAFELSRELLVLLDIDRILSPDGP